MRLEERKEDEKEKEVDKGKRTREVDKGRRKWDGKEKGKGRRGDGEERKRRWKELRGGR